MERQQYRFFIKEIIFIWILLLMGCATSKVQEVKYPNKAKSANAHTDALTICRSEFLYKFNFMADQFSFVGQPVFHPKLNDTLLIYFDVLHQRGQIMNMIGTTVVRHNEIKLVGLLLKPK